MNATFQQNLWKLSMIIAPLLLFISQFYWNEGVLTATAGALQVLSFLFWIFAFQGLFEHLKQDYPVYAVLGFFLAVYGCLAGSNFGVDGIYIDAVHNLYPDSELPFNGKTGPAAMVAFFIPGILAPLQWVIVGFLLFKANRIPFWRAPFLMIGGIGFPLSRIPRIEWVAHLDNLILLFAMIIIVMKLYPFNDVKALVSKS